MVNNSMPMTGRLAPNLRLGDVNGLESPASTPKRKLELPELGSQGGPWEPAKVNKTIGNPPPFPCDAINPGLPKVH